MKENNIKADGVKVSAIDQPNQNQLAELRQLFLFDIILILVNSKTEQTDCTHFGQVSSPEEPQKVEIENRRWPYFSSS